MFDDSYIDEEYVQGDVCYRQPDGWYTTNVAIAYDYSKLTDAIMCAIHDARDLGINDVGDFGGVLYTTIICMLHWTPTPVSFDGVDGLFIVYREAVETDPDGDIGAWVHEWFADYYQDEVSLID
jgi:hypothetical protein